MPLAQVARVLAQMLLYPLALAPSARQPTRHRPLVIAKRHDDCLQEGQYEIRLEQDDSVWASREERDRMAGELYAGLAESTGQEFIDHEIEVWDKMIVALDQGQLRPTHLRGRKPD